MSIEKQISAHKRYTIPVILVGIFVTVLFFVDFDYFESFFAFNPSDTFQLFLADGYVKLGILAIVFYEFIPSIFKLIGTSGFFVGLLDSGVSPFMLVLLATVGKVGGQYLMYLFGKFLFRVFKGKHRDMARADHFLHKYKVLVFLIVPFTGTLGNIIMVVAGHERLGFIKIAPLLFVGSLFRVSIWLFFFIGQMDLADVL